MKKIFSTLALALAAFAAQAAPMLTSAGICDVNDVTGAYACAGGFAGNDLGTPANVLAVGGQFATLGGFDNPFELIDNSNGTRGSQVALIYETGGKTGQLILEDPSDLLPFSIFGISLKAGNYYSLYLFDGGSLNGTLKNLGTTLTGLQFTTEGVGLNHKDVPLGLSHAALWGFEPTNFGGGCLLDPALCNPTSVPEPGTLALLAAGLAGVGFTSARRRKHSV